MTDDRQARSALLHKALGLGDTATKTETVEQVLAVLKALDVTPGVASPIVEALLEVVNDDVEDDVFVDGLEIVDAVEYHRRAAQVAARRW